MSKTKVLPAMSPITRRLKSFADVNAGSGVTAHHIKAWEKRWSWLHLLIGQSSDNQLFASAFWWRRLLFYMLVAAVTVAFLLVFHVVAITIPMTPLWAVPFVVAIPLGIAFQFALDFLRDYLTPTTPLESYINLPRWLRWFFRANDTDKYGGLARQCVGDQAEVGSILPELYDDRTDPEAYVPYLYTPVGNTYRSWLRGAMFIVATIISVALLTSAFTSAGFMALAVPGGVSLGLATLAALCNRLGMRLARSRLRHATPTADFSGQWKKSDDQGRQWLANTFFATSGLLAILAVMAVVWVGWPSLLIVKTFAFLQLPVITSVPAAATAVAAMAAGVSLGVGGVVGSLRSLAHWASGERSLFTATQLTGRVVNPDINADDSVRFLKANYSQLTLYQFNKSAKQSADSLYGTESIDDDSPRVPC